MKTFTSSSPKQTFILGKRLAKIVKRKWMKEKGNIVILVIGELGVGKTLFTHGFFTGLGYRETDFCGSPSFIIVNEYKGCIPFYHIDLYRLKTVEGIEEIFEKEGVIVCEWGEKIENMITFLWKIEFTILNNKRIIKIT